MLYIILIPLIIFGYKDGNDIKKERARASIVKCIPRFTNQLLLLMNAGLILSDAFKRICDSYEIIPVERRCLFETLVLEVNGNNSGNERTTSVLVSELAGTYNVKELMRIATFMAENEKRGSNIIESLSRESKYLWNDRKIIAKEKGKAIDTKMTYPLGLLLILLIVITMAPALLAM